MYEHSKGEFSVYQFFPDESYSQEARFVAANEAAAIAKQLMRSVGAKLGTTVRVIITDGGDCCVFEWIHGKGIVFPPDLVGKPDV